MAQGDVLMKFYSVAMKKSIEIPTNKIKTVSRSGRKFAVGTYTWKGKSCEAWRVLPSGKAKK